MSWTPLFFFCFSNTHNACVFCDPSLLLRWKNREIQKCWMLLSCSDKVINTAISPSSPKDRYKTYFENCTHIFSKDSWLIVVTVQSFRLTYVAVIQRTLSKGVSKLKDLNLWQIGPSTSTPSDTPPLQAAGVVQCRWNACCCRLGHKMVPGHATESCTSPGHQYPRRELRPETSGGSRMKQSDATL